MIKSRGKPEPRYVGLGVLLFALAIQGITPDTDDLASSALPRLLAANIATSLDRLGSTSKHVLWPHQDPEKGEQDPDDACAPVISGIRSTNHAESFRSRFLADSSSTAISWVPLSLPHCAATRRAPVQTQRDRIHSLCRLIC